MTAHVKPAWKLAVPAMFCCGWGGNQFTPLLLLYRRDGGYSAVTVDLFLGAYVIGLVPGLLLAGALSDRHGRKPMMVAGTSLSLLASVTRAAYGIAMVSGLLEIQRITAPNGVADLAGLTGVYYAAAYAGFLLPSALATVAGIAPYTVLLSVVALITLGCTAAVLVSSRAHLPLPEPA